MSDTNICPDCSDIQERPDVPHTIRKCSGCGRDVHVAEPGDGGNGLQVKTGDRLSMPLTWLQTMISLDPLKNSAKFTHVGIEWFVTQIFMAQAPDLNGNLIEYFETSEKAYVEILKNSPLLAGLDIEREVDQEEIVKRLEVDKNTPEWWALAYLAFAGNASTAFNNNEASQSIWAAMYAERARLMCLYKEHLENVVHMGHAASRIVETLRIWENNKENSQEEFWQSTFSEHSYALSQAFAIPLVIINEKAYVGGTQVDRSSSKFVDYLGSMESSREAVLIEIKTPKTRLLGKKYRALHNPSSELSGSIVQALDYRISLSKSIDSLNANSKYDLEVTSPRCIIIAGNRSELDTDKKKKSFEIFRGSLKDIEVVTFDELFRKVEILINLFGLARKGKNA